MSVYEDFEDSLGQEDAHDFGYTVGAIAQDCMHTSVLVWARHARTLIESGSDSEVAKGICFEAFGSTYRVEVAANIGDGLRGYELPSGRVVSAKEAAVETMRVLETHRSVEHFRTAFDWAVKNGN